MPDHFNVSRKRSSPVLDVPGDQEITRGVRSPVVCYLLNEI